MARSALLAFGVAAAAMLTAIPGARAQCRLCETPTTMAKQEGPGSTIELQVEASLDFDRLVVMGDGEGTATLLPDGTRQMSGSVEAISGRAMVGEARVRGEPGRAIRVDLPRALARRRLRAADGPGPEGGRVRGQRKELS